MIMMILVDRQVCNVGYENDDGHNSHCLSCAYAACPHVSAVSLHKTYSESTAMDHELRHSQPDLNFCNVNCDMRVGMSVHFQFMYLVADAFS